MLVNEYSKEGWRQGHRLLGDSPPLAYVRGAACPKLSRVLSTVLSPEYPFFRVFRWKSVVLALALALALVRIVPTIIMR